MPIAPPDKDRGSRRRRRRYTLPQNFRTEAPTRRAVPKAGPPSPQRTGVPTRPQPVTRKRTAPPTRTDRLADSRRTPAQRRRDEAAVLRNVRQARRDYLARTGRGPSLAAVIRTMTAGATPNSRHTGRIVPGAQAQPLANLPVISFPTVRAQDPEITARKIAPVLTVLEQTSRPVHAVAAGARATIADINKHGYQPFGTAEGRRAAQRAAVRGFELKDRSLFSDVLAEAGVKNKAIRGVAGFGLDVALDPLTYLTAGGASTASAAARSAARAAERKAFRSVAAREAARKAGEIALAHGASPREASRIARQAAQRHARRAGKRAGEQAARGKATNTGLDIRFRGRSVPGLVRGTSAAKRAPRALAQRTGVEGTRVGQAVDRAQQGTRNAIRSSAAEFSPAITPVGVGRAEYQAMRRAARTARAGSQRGDVRAALVAQSFVDRVGRENFQRVIYAVEEGTTKQLPSPLRAEAARFTQAMQKLLKAERRAGIKVGDRTKAGDVAGYVKHLRVKDDAVTPARAGRSGARKVAPDFAKRRTEGTLREKNNPTLVVGRDLAEAEALLARKRPGTKIRAALEKKVERLRDELEEARRIESEGPRYSEDLGQLVAQRTSKSARSVAAAKLNQALAKTGRAIPRDVDLKTAVKDGESVYRVEGPDLVKLDVGKARDRNLIEKTGRGRFVILNDNALERTAGTVAPAGARTTPGVFFDKAQGVWKIGATVVNPGYYVRNYAGEAQNAWLKEHPARLARNAVRAGRALREVKAREEALRRGEKYVPGKYGKLIEGAEDVGAVRAGQYAREVGQLLSKESKKTRTGRLKGAGPLRRAARIRDNIEDQFRLASYMGGLDRGLKPEAAMQRASKTHFDYGDLTATERKVLRRVAPFYTFTARNVPLQIKSLLTRPGKFAQYEKLRQEFAKAFGFEEDWELRTSEYEQRGAAVPIKWKGVEFTLSLGPSGLPLTDLNEFAVPGTSQGAAALGAEWMSRAASMVTPAVKSPVELWANFSFFFRDQLERDTSPLVPAPAWAQHLPRQVKDMAGLVPDYYDRRTGKYTWGWRAKADYLVNQVPGPAAFANRLTKESSRSGQSGAMKTLAYFGPRIRQIDTAAQTLVNLYDERDAIERQQAALRQRNIKTGRVPKNAQADFLALKQRTRIINASIRQLQLRIEAPQSSVATKQQEVLRSMAAPATPARSAEQDEILRKMAGG